MGSATAFECDWYGFESLLIGYFDRARVYCWVGPYVNIRAMYTEDNTFVKPSV